MRQILSEAGATASNPFKMPAPVGGWNARDSLDMMKTTDAIYLDNWFPTQTTVDIRPGSAVSSLLPVDSVIKSLLNCAKQDGTARRFAVCQTGVYDIATAIATLDLALTDARVESVNINIAGLPYLWCCNGVDKSFIYKSDTDTWIPLDGASVPALTGITSTDVANVSMWKNRLILTKKASLEFWYMPLNSVGGLAVKFDLGSVFKKGGYLVATANWSVDAGDGTDDRFVAVTSEGEVAIYQGTDPSAAATFALVGVYHVGRPVGKRCFTQIGGDLALLCDQGLWPLSRALESSTIDRKPALTNKIEKAFNAYFKEFSAQYGWQPLLLSKGPALLVNVPITALFSYQFVMNTISGAWCRFIGWSASCMMESDGDLYFAIGRTVWEGWTGMADSGAAIVGYGKQAFTYGPRPGRIEHVKLVQPIFTATSSVVAQLALDTDFADRRLLSSSTNFLQQTGIWDTSRFDQAYWSGGDVTINSWKTVAHKPGNAWSLRMRMSVKDIAVSWIGTRYISEPGGLFG